MKQNLIKSKGSRAIIVALAMVASLLGAVAPTATANAAVTWTKQTSAPYAAWQSIASSADGTKLAAVSQYTGDYSAPGSIYTSTDSGATWTEQTGAGHMFWSRIASSADGTKLVAVSIYSPTYGVGGIFTSTDSGVTWTKQTGVAGQYWYSVASSSDGTKLVAGSLGDATHGFGTIFTSADSGVTWTEQTVPTTGYWYSIASSSDGSKLAAVQFYSNGYGAGKIYTSSDSGVTWTAQSSAGDAGWMSIASSSDGTKLAAVSSQAGSAKGGVFTSNDSGVTWVQQAGAESTYWQSIASSSDGTHLAAAEYYDPSNNPGSIFTSTDSGVTWTKETAPGAYWWLTIASDSTGSKLAAANQTGDPTTTGIWTSVGMSAAPTIASLSPITGPASGGTNVTITGTGFVAGAYVKVGVGACTNVVVVSSTTLTCTTAPGLPANSDALVQNVDTQYAVSYGAFTYLGAVFSASTPAIPNTYVGATSPVQTETITNVGNANLLFGARAVSKTGVNAADFTIVADKCSGKTLAPAATCTVTYKFKSSVAGTRTANLVFASNSISTPDVVALSAVAMGVVTIKKIDSTSGSIKGGITVEITGSGFNATSTVTFGGLAAVVTKRTGTTGLTVKTPAHAAGAVPVVVSNADGGTATYNSYTYKK